MAVVDDHELHASSSSKPMPEMTTAPVLKSWSRCQGAARSDPIYGTKDVLFRRLCEWQQNAAKEKKEEEYLEQEERVGVGDRAR